MEGSSGQGLEFLERVDNEGVLSSGLRGHVKQLLNKSNLHTIDLMKYAEVLSVVVAQCWNF